MNEVKTFKITFLTNDRFKILDFELVNYAQVQNINIYNMMTAELVLRDARCRLSSKSLLELFRFYYESDCTLEDYIDGIIKHGFFSAHVPNLTMRIETENNNQNTERRNSE